MQLKSITAIIVLSLVVASLSMSGCINNTNPANQTPSAATHDAFLENYLAHYKNAWYADKNFSINAWELTWVNGTSTQLEYTFVNKSTNATVNSVETFIIFPTTQDTSNYLNAMNKTEYSLASTQYTNGGAYQLTTGHAPQVYKDYVWNEGNPFNISEYRRHEIEQLDNMIVTATLKRLS